jgi:hypothetical protein
MRSVRNLIAHLRIAYWQDKQYRRECADRRRAEHLERQRAGIRDVPAGFLG